MNKKLVLGLALALVLVSGPFIGAQAECGFGCLPHISLPSCLSCGGAVDRDRDRQIRGNLPGRIFLWPDNAGSDGLAWCLLIVL